MGVLVFSIFWILVAIALVFVALSGGPRGARERLHTQSHRGRKAWFIAFGLLLVGLGIVVPAAVIAGVTDRKSVPEANISKLTDEEERGRKLFAEQCRNCHTLKASAAAATVGPNLDVLRPTKGLVLDAIEQGRARGNGAMAADLVTGADADAVASYVARAVGQAGK